jgi:hypothetical protein
MRVVKNIIMEKVLVNYGSPCFHDKDLVALLGEFIIVSNLNITNVVLKVKERFVLDVLEIKCHYVNDFFHNIVFMGQNTLEICHVFKMSIKVKGLKVDYIKQMYKSNL